jgi:hypothetical protein
MNLLKAAVQPPPLRSGGGVRPMALRGGGEKIIVIIGFSYFKYPLPHLPPFLGGRG